MRQYWLPLVDRLILRLSARAGPSRLRDGGGGGRGVLVACSGGLGDALLFSVVVDRFAGLAQAGETLTVLLRKDTADAGFLYPPGVEVISVDYPRFLRSLSYRYGMCRDIAARGFRAAVSADHLRHPLIDDLLIAATGAPDRAAMVARSWPKYDGLLKVREGWYTRLKPVSDRLEHRLLRWVELANWLTERNDPVPVVSVAPERLPPVESLARPTVVLHPFSAIAERQYAPETYLSIIEGAVPDSHDIVLSVGPGDLDRNPDFRPLADHRRVRTDDRSLESKAQLLRGAALLVSADTSLMHLGVLVGAPVICLAAAAHLRDSIPYDPRMTPENVRFLLKADMACAGCLGNCILPLEGGRYPCIARMERSMILAAVRESLVAPKPS